MNDKDRGELLKIVDSSGFAFQSKVAHLFKESLSDRPDIIEEQYWCLPDEKKDGYIDIIAVLEHVRFIVECKKSTDDNWIFLSPKPVKNHLSNKFRWVHFSKNNNSYYHGWDEFHPIDLHIPESAQCVLSKSKREFPLLEVIGSTLLDSVKAISNDEMRISCDYKKNMFYVPIIVTTARLHLCEYDYDSVDINTGKIKFDKILPEIQEIPFVRFRKSMGNSFTSEDFAKDLKSISINNERTIFVVSSSALLEFIGILNKHSLITLTRPLWPE
jgi:hypothetical protein